MSDTVQVKQVIRLAPEVYKTLAGQLPKPSCPKDPIEAGFQCGIQYVLEKLRAGFVVEEQ